MISNPVKCPCCGNHVSAPTVDIVVDHCKITVHQEKILRAIWRGKGQPIKTERIFDAMYADHPDGGLSKEQMYLSFKVALCHMRKKLKGSGFSIETVGYRSGYRLVTGGAATAL